MNNPIKRILSTPLKADRRGSFSAVRVVADGYNVASINPAMNDAEAYAKLFSASPDMLGALRIALPALKESAAPEVVALVELAIAKAEGRP